MPRRCIICGHSDRNQLDHDILSGVPNRRIASRVDCSEAAVRRHANAHLTERLKRAHAARETALDDSLAAKLAEIEAEARRLARLAEEGGDLRTAVACLRELIRVSELLARLRGEIEDARISVVSVEIDSETARRIAETYLARHRQAESTPAVALLRGTGP